MIRRPPRSTRTDTLFPYTTLFRSKTVAHASGHLVAASRSGELSVLDAHGRERERYKLPYGATIDVKDGAAVKAGQSVAHWDPHNHPIVSEVAGFIRFVDFIDGVTVIQKTERSKDRRVGKECVRTGRPR